jgi:signal transduction histidine kinase
MSSACRAPSRALAIALLALAAAAPAQEPCRSASQEEARALALKAAKHLETRTDPLDAFHDFMRARGGFLDRDLYVFVVDFSGNMWANGAFPEFAGSNAIGAVDTDGRLYMIELLTLAQQQGEGWVRYRWFNPCSGSYMMKATFFKRVGPFVVAVGAYVP